ncbi:MAG: circularly permuted type 2 ATP-grasp protein [Cyanobacteria bacterium P01_C01_bin.120]
MKFDAYSPQNVFDEYVSADGDCRSLAEPVVQWLQQKSSQELAQSSADAQAVLDDLGATFTTVHGETQTLPFDPVPRLISQAEWQTLSAGLKQRIAALNLFCADVYGDQEICRDEVIPLEVIESAKRYLPICRGLRPPQDVWCHVSGIDLVRDRQGQWCVLEDNVRDPSGIAYVLKNRQAMQRVAPQLLETMQPQPVDDYAHQLQIGLESFQQAAQGTVAILTRGPEISSYFEHQTLAEQMQIPLIEAKDLAIREGALHFHSDRGWQRLAGLYRRCDTELLQDLDLGNGTADSLAAIIELCQQGQLAFANTLGAGIADDKVIYGYVPDIIRFYLDAEPLLPNVPTYLCWRDRDRQYVLDHLDELVVKSASAEGGQDMLFGIHSTAEERATFADKIRDQPRGYMAQPTLTLSQIPTIIDGKLAPRHTDLRPFIIHQGDDIYVYPGGLTRVALEAGELVVNSSQGGGSKDTWILPE